MRNTEIMYTGEKVEGYIIQSVLFEDVKKIPLGKKHTLTKYRVWKIES